jgi:hypothetical protein
VFLQIFVHKYFFPKFSFKIFTKTFFSFFHESLFTNFFSPNQIFSQIFVLKFISQTFVFRNFPESFSKHFPLFSRKFVRKLFLFKYFFSQFFVLIFFLKLLFRKCFQLFPSKISPEYIRKRFPLFSQKACSQTFFSAQKKRHGRWWWCTWEQV